jgi:FAD synthase
MTILSWDHHGTSGELFGFHPLVAAMGVFDGVHLGHKKLLQKPLDYAKTNGGQAWVITFDTNPARMLNQEAYPGDIQSLNQKIETLEQLGFAGVILLPFDQDFRNQESMVFLERFMKWFPLDCLYVGENFHLGKYPGSTAQELQDLFVKLGTQIRVDITDLANHNGTTVSSTIIRNTLLQGDLNHSNTLLGRPFRIDLRGIPLLRHGGIQGILKKWTKQLLPQTGTFFLTITGSLGTYDSKGWGTPEGFFWDQCCSNQQWYWIDVHQFWNDKNHNEKIGMK